MVRLLTSCPSRKSSCAIFELGSGVGELEYTEDAKPFSCLFDHSHLILYSWPSFARQAIANSISAIGSIYLAILPVIITYIISPLFFNSHRIKAYTIIFA
jgi:hypothetical protein